MPYIALSAAYSGQPIAGKHHLSHSDNQDEIFEPEHDNGAEDHREMEAR